MQREHQTEIVRHKQKKRSRVLYHLTAFSSIFLLRCSFSVASSVSLTFTDLNQHSGRHWPEITTLHCWMNELINTEIKNWFCGCIIITLIMCFRFPIFFIRVLVFSLIVLPVTIQFSRVLSVFAPFFLEERDWVKLVNWEARWNKDVFLNVLINSEVLHSLLSYLLL